MTIHFTDNNNIRLNNDLYGHTIGDNVMYVYPHDKRSRDECYIFPLANIYRIDGLNQEQIRRF